MSCGSCRFNTKDSQAGKLGVIGSSFRLIVWNGKDKQSQTGVWGMKDPDWDDKNFTALKNSFARAEGLSHWLKSGWKKAVIENVDGYTEKHQSLDKTRFYNLGSTRKIAAIYKNGKFRIITREAKGAEKEVKDRFPLIVNYET